MAVAQTIGIEMPDDFPTAAYNAVNVRLGRYQPRNPALWGEYAGGWKAVAIRFRTAASADEKFTANITRNSAASLDDRQLEEEALFSFFVTGYSAVESFSYALFALGAMLEPAEFPMSTKEDLRRIGPTLTERKFTACFGGTAVEARLSALIADRAYCEWGLIRNVLAHRQAPPRQHAMTVMETIGGGGGGGTQRGSTTWQIIGGLVLDDRTTATRRAWLAAALTDCIEATDDFASGYFP